MMLSFFLLGQVWDDHSMWNRDFSELCPSFTLVRLNRLELAVLEMLRVSVAISTLDPTVDGACAAFFVHVGTVPLCRPSLCRSRVTVDNVPSARDADVHLLAYKRGRRKQMRICKCKQQVGADRPTLA